MTVWILIREEVMIMSLSALGKRTGLPINEG